MLTLKHVWPVLCLTLCIGIGFLLAVDPTKKTVLFTVQETQNILFSQTGIRPYTSDGIPLTELSKDMKTSGFKKESPIEVVEMRTNQFTSLDNRRLAAAQNAEVPVHAVVHQPESKLPQNQQRRFDGATTYGNAVNNRMRTGSFDANSVKASGVFGFPSQEIRIRTNKENTKDFEAFKNRNIVSPFKRQDEMYRPNMNPTLTNIREGSILDTNTKPFNHDEHKWPSLGDNKSPSSSRNAGVVTKTGAGEATGVWGQNTGSSSGTSGVQSVWRNTGSNIGSSSTSVWRSTGSNTGSSTGIMGLSIGSSSISTVNPVWRSTGSNTGSTGIITGSNIGGSSTVAVQPVFGSTGSNPGSSGISAVKPVLGITESNTRGGGYTGGIGQRPLNTGRGSYANAQKGRVGYNSGALNTGSNSRGVDPGLLSTGTSSTGRGTIGSMGSRGNGSPTFNSGLNSGFGRGTTITTFSSTTTLTSGSGTTGSNSGIGRGVTSSNRGSTTFTSGSGNIGSNVGTSRGATNSNRGGKSGSKTLGRKAG